MNLDQEFVRVTFEIEDEDAAATGVSAEHVWAKPVDEDEYELRNTPMFAFGFSFGDIVRARLSGEGYIVVAEALSRSGHSTLRVYLASEAESPRAKAAIQELGATTHGSDAPGLFAIDIEPEVALNPILEWLERRTVHDEFGFEVGFVAHDHGEEVAAIRGEQTPAWIQRYLQ